MTSGAIFFGSCNDALLGPTFSRPASNCGQPDRRSPALRHQLPRSGSTFAEKQRNVNRDKAAAAPHLLQVLSVTDIRLFPCTTGGSLQLPVELPVSDVHRIDSTAILQHTVGKASRSQPDIHAHPASPESGQNDSSPFPA